MQTATIQQKQFQYSYLKKPIVEKKKNGSLVELSFMLLSVMTLLS